jgi:hypothetical protein
MTAYSALQTYVSRDLSDPSNLTFDTDAVKDFIQKAIAEVGRVSPQQFQEDITPVDGQLTYLLRSDDFNAVAVPEIRLVRVEVWDDTPAFRFSVKAKAGQPSRYSNSGWEVWNGTLEIPSWVETNISATDTIRVWGYSPYPPISDDADVVPVSADLELAIRDYCRVQALRKLTSSRVLFKQWQARSNNTDVTLAMLNSDLQQAEQDWRRMSRELRVPEQNPD